MIKFAKTSFFSLSLSLLHNNNNRVQCSGEGFNMHVLILSFFSLSGKSRIYIFSNFYLRVYHEDRSVRFCTTFDSVSAECLELAWFHHCHDWVTQIEYSKWMPVCQCSSQATFWDFWPFWQGTKDNFLMRFKSQKLAWSRVQKSLTNWLELWTSFEEPLLTFCNFLWE